MSVRRAPLFGPLLMIALGLVLLVQNLTTSFSAWEFLVGSWPWLLILWGVSWMLEYGVSRWFGTRRPRALGGGSLVAALAICLLGSGLQVARGERIRGLTAELLEFDGFDDIFDFPIEAEFDATDCGAVRIEGSKGDWRVVGEDAMVVAASGRKRVRAWSAARARDRSAEMTLSWTCVDGQGLLRVEGGADGAWYELELSVPRAAALTLLAHGDTAVSGIDGPLALESQHGARVEVQDAGGAISIEGSARLLDVRRVAGPLRIAGNLFGRLSLEEISGETELVSKRTRLKAAGLPGSMEINRNRITLEQTEGPLKLEARDARRIELLDWRGEAEVSARRADVRAKAGEQSGGLAVRVERGDIRLELDPQGDFRIDSRAGGGVFNEGLLAGDQGRLAENYESPPHSASQAAIRVRLESRDGRIELVPAQATQSLEDELEGP